MTDQQINKLLLDLFSLYHSQQVVLDETTIALQALSECVCEEHPSIVLKSKMHREKIKSGPQGQLRAQRLKEVEVIIEELRKGAGG